MDKIKKAFINDLEQNGDYWRIYRLSTIIDLIQLDFVHYQKSKKDEYLYSIINNNIKLKMLSLSIISPITITEDKEEFLAFNSDNDLIISKLSQVLDEFNTDNTNNDFFDLKEGIEKLSLINQNIINLNSTINQIIQICIDLINNQSSS